MAGSLFSCSEIQVTIPGRRLVDALSMHVERGELIAILGKNGSGKTLTLHTLAGLRGGHGSVRIADSSSDINIDVISARRQDVARHLALLPQHVDDIFPASVMDTVLVGRHPHIGRLNWESAHDFEVAKAALEAVDLADMAERDVMTLSGGERRRLAIAQVIAQAPDVYLLDEPTNHLDPQHQLDTLRLFRAKADAGSAVIACLHDVNLAVRFADRCLLLHGDGHWDLGVSRDILNPERLSQLFSTPFEAVVWRDQPLYIAT